MSQDVQWGCPRTSNRDVLRESVTERHWSFPSVLDSPRVDHGDKQNIEPTTLRPFVILADDEMDFLEGGSWVNSELFVGWSNAEV